MNFKQGVKKVLVSGLMVSLAVVTLSTTNVNAVEINDKPTDYKKIDLYQSVDLNKKPIVAGKTIKDYALIETNMEKRFLANRSSYGTLEEVSYKAFGRSYDEDIQLFSGYIKYDTFIKKFPTEASLKEKQQKAINHKDLPLLKDDFYKIGKKFYNELKPGKTVNGHKIKATTFELVYEYKIDLTKYKGALYAYVYQDGVLLSTTLLDTSFRNYKSLQSNINFKDVSGAFKPHIDRLVALGILEGKTSTKFAPNDNITNAQFAAMLHRLTPNAPTTIQYVKLIKDVKKTDWFANDIYFLYQSSVINVTTSNGNDYVRPNVQITRQEAAETIVQYVEQVLSIPTKKVKSNVSVFKDASSIDKNKQSAVGKLYTLGVISGKKDKNGKVIFDPKGKLTRAQMAKIVDNVLNLTVDGDLKNPVNKK